jgi:hypothetical protein
MSHDFRLTEDVVAFLKSGDSGSESDNRACYVVCEDQRGFGSPESIVAELLVVGIYFGFSDGIFVGEMEGCVWKLTSGYRDFYYDFSISWNGDGSSD